jgi:hypothetical protein
MNKLSSFFLRRNIMGASSVTGVSGPGSVAGRQRGSEHMSLAVSKLIGPRVAAAGRITLSGLTGVVQFPELVGSINDYVVMVSANSSTLAYVSTALAVVSGVDQWTFTITGGSGAVVNWTVVKVG